MVRAHMKQPTEEKKEKKKTSSKKKVQETGVWPCKINGCNKEFAREADLKRHQRTTKLHSQPGLCVACPQCEATFTRTDALRRHQKSRHNGLILEPINLEGKPKDGTDDDAASPTPSINSRGGTPKRSRGSNAGASSSSVPSAAPAVLAQPDTAGPGPANGQQSYYRQHTVTPVFVSTRTPHGVLDSAVYHAGTQLPTSATRLHGANWPPAPPWQQDGSGAHRPSPGQGPAPGQLPYPVPPHGVYYPPGAYYRSAGGQPAGPPGLDSPPQMQGGSGLANGHDGAPPPGHANANIDPSLGASGDAEMTDAGAAGGEDARLNGPPDATSFADREGMNAAVRKAIQAVLAIDPSLGNTLEQVVARSVDQQQERSASGDPPVEMQEDKQTEGKLEAALAYDHQAQPGHHEDNSGNGQLQEDVDADIDADADGEADMEGDVEGDVIASGSTQKRAQIEHSQMLTEDGEPMLRPEELLNAESLASPPPS